MSDGKQISEELLGCTCSVGIGKDFGEELTGALGGNVLSRGW
jgi:hypothetical protein